MIVRVVAVREVYYNLQIVNFTNCQGKRRIFGKGSRGKIGAFEEISRERFLKFTVSPE